MAAGFAPGSPFDGVVRWRQGPRRRELPLADRLALRLAEGSPAVPAAQANGVQGEWGVPVAYPNSLGGAIAALVQETPDRIEERMLTPHQRVARDVARHRAERQADASAEAAAAVAVAEAEQERVDAETRANFDWDAHLRDEGLSLDELLADEVVDDDEGDYWEAA